MRSSFIRLASTLASVALAGCSPAIILPNDAPRAELIISRTSPGVHIEQIALNDTSIGTPQFSFDIPTGTQRVVVRLGIAAGEFCDSTTTRCERSTWTGTCGGSFPAVANRRYRILVDTRQGDVTASIRERSLSLLYLGQDEHLVSPMTCETMRGGEGRTLSSIE